MTQTKVTAWFMLTAPGQIIHYSTAKIFMVSKYY